MAIFNDTFTDSNKHLESHTPDTGTSWSVVWQTTAGKGFEISSNTCTPTGTTLNSGAIYSANGSYPGANYSVEITMTTLNISGGSGFWLLARLADQDNFYAARIDDQNGTGTCRIYKKVSGTFTALGSAFDPPADGSVVKFTVNGTSLTV